MPEFGNLCHFCQLRIFSDFKPEVEYCTPTPFNCRLISERTVEENILKKANQKRMLGDMAIEGGNFTTAILKEQTIKDLFVEPSGLQSLVGAEEERAPGEGIKEVVKPVKEEKKKEQMVQSEKNIMAQFEKVNNL